MTFAQRLARRTRGSSREAGNIFKKIGTGIQDTLFKKHSYLAQGLKKLSDGSHDFFGAFAPVAKDIGGAVQGALNTGNRLLNNPLVQAGLTTVAPELGVSMATINKIQGGIARGNNVINAGQNALSQARSLTNTDLFKSTGSALNQLEKAKPTMDAISGLGNAIRSLGPHNDLAKKAIMDFMPR